MITVTCGTCGVAFSMTEAFHRLRKQDHETFYCPNGHPRYYPEKNDDEQKIEQLEKQVARFEKFWDQETERCHEWMNRYELMRGGAMVCPLGCGWKTSRRTSGWPPDPSGIARFFDRVWGDLRQHLIHEHNATMQPVALLNAGSDAGESD